LTRGVLSVGLASFFSDSGHEITTSILPTFVTTTLRSSAGALGVIEGISDALLGVAKLVAGPFANDPRRRREIARGGYVVTAVATGAIGLAATVWQAGVLRAGSWVARGARSPARDALLASLVAPSAFGRAFGLERAGDNLGAVVGPLLAAVLVANLGIRPALYLAAVPGVFAAVAITAAAAAAARRDSGEAPAPIRRRIEVRAVLGSGLARPLIAIGLFEFGNCATTLLILRATGLLHHGGRSMVAATSLAIGLYAANNLLGAIVALGGGHWIDRIGPRVPFAGGALLFACSYAVFAAGPHGWLPLLLAFMLSGSGIGLAETAESALVATHLPDRLRGRAPIIIASGVLRGARGDAATDRLRDEVDAWGQHDLRRAVRRSRSRARGAGAQATVRSRRLSGMREPRRGAAQERPLSARRADRDGRIARREVLNLARDVLPPFPAGLGERRDVSGTRADSRRAARCGCRGP
jgi:MFS family permease